MNASQPLHVPAAGGHSHNLLGLPTINKLSAEDTGGAYILAEQIVPPGMGVPPHVHTNEDEVFFVLDGEIEFVVGDRVIVGKAGDVLHAPRGVPHGYKGAGSKPARGMFMAIPGAIGEMFAEMATWPQDAPPDMGKLAQLCGKFGITFV